MISKTDFTNELYKKIVTALQKCDENNVIDMRLYIDDNSCNAGIYSIFEVNELYEEVKKHPCWFIDFYENIKDANTAEFMDIALFSHEIKQEHTPCATATFVWCVLINQVVNDEELRNNVRIFAEKEDAKEYANDFIADERQYTQRDGWIEEGVFETEETWCAYRAGEYASNHTSVILTKEQVL